MDSTAETRLDALVRTLRERGHRLTPQRVAILAALVRDASHPTADELHRRILPDFPTTSLATVYKTLALLKEHGEVLELATDGLGGKAGPGCRFDGRRPRPHPHFVCTRCGKISDPDDSPENAQAEGQLTALVDRLARRSGHMVDSVRLDLFGLCQDCRQSCCQD